MIQLNRKAFLLFSFEKRLYSKRKWLLRVSDVQLPKDEPDEFPTLLKDGRIVFLYEGVEHVITGIEKGRPIFPEFLDLELNSGELPTIKSKVKTSYRTAIRNIFIYEAFGEKIPYINGPTGKKVLTPYVEEGLRNGTITIEERLKFSRINSFLEVLIDSCVVVSTDQVIKSSPKTTALKKKLIKEFSDRLDDPVVVAKINDQLKESLKEELKNSPAFPYLNNPKLLGKSRLMTHAMMGGVPRLDDPTKVYTVTNSLIEGIEPEDLPAVINNLRSGSIDRGDETAKGGAAAKGSNRIYQNTKVSEDDCATKLGHPIKVTPYNKDLLIGHYKPGESKPLDEAKIKSLMGKTILVRLTTVCATANGNYCKRCMGDKVANSVTNIGPYMAEFSNVFMQISLAQFHGRVLKTTDYNFLDNIS